MTSSYPRSVDPITLPNFNHSMGDPARPQSALMVDFRDSIRAVETTLGLDPAGAETDVKTRLNAIDARMTALENAKDTTPARFPMTWSIPGPISAGIVGMGFPLVGAWDFQACVLTVGNASSSGLILVNIQFNGGNLFEDGNRPRILAGAREGSQTGPPTTTHYAGTGQDPDRFTLSIDAVGGSDPGRDLVVAFYLVSSDA